MFGLLALCVDMEI